PSVGETVSRVNAHADPTLSESMPAANKPAANLTCITRSIISPKLNNNAIDRRNTCNAGRTNYRSSMREDYLAVPKTVCPRLRRQRRRPQRREAQRPQARSRHRTLRQQHRLSNLSEQQSSRELVRLPIKSCA